MFNKDNNKTNYKYYQSIKKIIKIDIDKLKNSLIYKDNIIGTIPKELILKGKELYVNSDIYLKKFPIEKLLFDIEKVYITGFLYFFDKTKTLELSNNSKNVTIFNSLELKNLDKLIIPYYIDSFKIIRRDNKINTINIKYNDEILTIKLPRNTLNKKGNIEISKDNDNNLIILIDFNTKIEYKVFIKDNKLDYKRKYFKYEITKDRMYLDLIELKKLFDAEFIFNEPLEIMKLTIEKKDLPLIYQIPFNEKKLKKIDIKDENAMSLFPKDKKIRISSNAWIKDKELLNNKILLIIYNSRFKEDRVMLINDDLSSITISNFWWQDTSKYKIEELVFSYDHTKFIKEEKENNRIRLIIPIENSIISIKDSEILKYLVKNSENIIVLKNDKELFLNEIENDKYISDITFIDKNTIYLTDEEKLIYSKYFSTYRYDYNKKTNIFDKTLLDYGIKDKENVYSNLFDYSPVNKEKQKALVKELEKCK